MLIDSSKQVLNENWIKKINSSISDRGNQLLPDELLLFSKTINITELKNYRLEVGRKTRKIIKGLKFTDFKKRFSQDSLERIFREKAVAIHPFLFPSARSLDRVTRPCAISSRRT